MAIKICEHSGMTIKFKSPSEEKNSSEFSVRFFIEGFFIVCIPFGLIFYSFSRKLGWWALLIVPLFFICVLIIRFIAQASADPFERKAQVNALTDNTMKMLKKEFAKTFYNYCERGK